MSAVSGVYYMFIKGEVLVSFIVLMYYTGLFIIGDVFYLGYLFYGISIIGVFILGIICYKRRLLLGLSIIVGAYYSACLLKGYFYRGIYHWGVSFKRLVIEGCVYISTCPF